MKNIEINNSHESQDPANLRERQMVAALQAGQNTANLQGSQDAGNLQESDAGDALLQESDMDNECPKCCCSERHKDRSAAEKKALLTRLRKIEGQIRGLQKMVENDIYCPDILTQSSAASSALNSFNKVLLSCHIRSCVAEDIREGNEEKIDELCQLLQKLMK